MSGNILAVDDTPEVLELLNVVLGKEGFRVKTAENVRDAIDVLKQSRPDLILMDILLPDILGTRFTQNLKRDEQYKDIPVILLTCKDSDVDVIEGLGSGADDYVSKPFNSSVLLARVKALLRRHKPELFDNSIINIGPIRIDPIRHDLTTDNGKVDLTPGEFKIVCELANNLNKPIERIELAQAINTNNTRVVDTHVTSIRKKLGSARKYLRTVHGIGYKFIEMN